LEFLEQALVVDVEAKRLGGCMEVGAVDEQGHLPERESVMLEDFSYARLAERARFHLRNR
jgi:hypothetical protein